MKLNDLKDKKILILGFGKEGKDTFLFLRRLFPNKPIGIADRLEFKNLKLKIAEALPHLSSSSTSHPSTIKNYKNVKWHLGKNYLKALENYDVIIKSPGIPIHLPEIKKAFKKGKITTPTQIFFDNCPGKIIGVTGTKGKSTTTALIYHILKKGLKASSSAKDSAGQVHLVGNIGKPVLNLLFSATPKDIYVYELSCHQLYKLKKSPQIAVYLNLYPEHLDYYKDFNEYASAKANIALWQTKNDYFIFNSRDKNVSKVAKKSKAKKIPIKGEYYDLNKAAARSVGKVFKIPSKIIEKAIKEFKPLPHRLELVGTFKGITFYNDALSTIPENTIFAIETLGKKVQTIFLGGFDRKINFKKLAKFILKNKNIKNLILFPTTGKKIWQEIVKSSRERVSVKLPRYFFVDNMRDAVKLAYQYTKKGKICLLSCASASFSIFKDYKEKGNLFKKYVKHYAP